MIFSGLELLGEIPFHDVIIHSTVLARRRAAHVEERSAPASTRSRWSSTHGADATRYGLLKMLARPRTSRFSLRARSRRARKLANKLWNVARLILQSAEGAAPAERPQALEERWILARIDADAREVEELPRRVRLRRTPSTRSTTSPSTTSATGTPRRSSRGSTTATPTRARPRSAALERLLKLLHPVHAARDRGDLVALADRETRLIVAPWPEAGDEPPTPVRSTACRSRADLPAQRRASPRSRATRSGSSTPSSGRSARQANGDVEAERERLRKEIARGGEDARERALRRRTRRPEVVEAEREKLERYRRELDALGD